MAKVKGVMLKFDVPNADYQVISKDCKINIPKIVPIEMEFNHFNPPIGSATVTRSDDALIFEGDIHLPYDDIIPSVLSEGVGGSGGWYNNIKKDNNGIITEMDLRSVSFVIHPVNPDYTFEIVKEEEK